MNRLSSIIDAESKATAYDYDVLGRRTKKTLADGSETTYDFDDAGRQFETTKPSGIKIKRIFAEYSGELDKTEYYNATGTLVGTDDYSYDAFLRRVGSTSRDNVVLVKTYTDRGQLDTDTTTYGSQSYVVNYDYDDRGRVTKVTYPSGRAAEYAFDDRGQLETVDWDGSTIETIGYDDLGRLNSVDRPFIDEARTYDAAGRLTDIDNTNVGDASYTYDANGNKQSESWTGVMAGWNFTTTNTGTYPSGYDDEDRFRNFVQSAKSVDLFLDRSDIGNITNYKLGTTDAFRSYSNTHELTTIDGTSQSFDVDGQLTDSHTGIELDWDEAGMLSSTIVSSGDTAGIEGTNEYGYDASLKRAWKKITRSGSVAEHTVFIYAGPNCIAEYASGTAASSPSQEYVYGQGIDSLKMIVRSGGTQKLTVTRNQQWSISALADHSNGNVLERYTYDAFGKRTILAADGSTVRTASSYDNPYGYTSRRHDDESGLMYFRARYYDTESGEFGSPDPLEYVDGMSMFRAYFALSKMDPIGTSIGAFLDNHDISGGLNLGFLRVRYGARFHLLDVQAKETCCEGKKTSSPTAEIGGEAFVTIWGATHQFGNSEYGYWYGVRGDATFKGGVRGRITEDNCNCPGKIVGAYEWFVSGELGLSIGGNIWARPWGSGYFGPTLEFGLFGRVSGSVEYQRRTTCGCNGCKSEGKVCLGASWRVQVNALVMNFGVSGSGKWCYPLN